MAAYFEKKTNKSMKMLLLLDERAKRINNKKLRKLLHWRYEEDTLRLV